MRWLVLLQDGRFRLYFTLNMTNYHLLLLLLFRFLRDLLFDRRWLWDLKHRVLVDLIAEMFLDGLFIDLLK